MRRIPHAHWDAECNDTFLCIAKNNALSPEITRRIRTIIDDVVRKLLLHSYLPSLVNAVETALQQQHPADYQLLDVVTDAINARADAIAERRKKIANAPPLREWHVHIEN